MTRDKALDLFAARTVLADLIWSKAGNVIILEYQRRVLAMEEALD